MGYLQVAALIAALGCCPQVTGERAAPTDAFEQLQALAGEWQAELPGFGTLTSSIRLVSNGKAIEETLGTAADNEVSIYSRDGHRVSLTHYCAMTPDGHVVRLATAPLRGLQHRFEFAFLEATNLPDAAAPHMKRVLMTLTDRDHFSQAWTKTEGGRETVFDLHFSRR
jgi:hypothetical protein